MFEDTPVRRPWLWILVNDKLRFGFLLCFYKLNSLPRCFDCCLNVKSFDFSSVFDKFLSMLCVFLVPSTTTTMRERRSFPLFFIAPSRNIHEKKLLAIFVSLPTSGSQQSGASGTSSTRRSLSVGLTAFQEHEHPENKLNEKTLSGAQLTVKAHEQRGHVVDGHHRTVVEFWRGFLLRFARMRWLRRFRWRMRADECSDGWSSAKYLAKAISFGSKVGWTQVTRYIVTR